MRARRCVACCSSENQKPPVTRACPGASRAGNLAHRFKRAPRTTHRAPGRMAPTPRSSEDRTVAALLAPDILELLEESPGAVAAETEELHPADLADVAEALPPGRVVALLAALPKERAADVLEYLDEELQIGRAHV